MHPVSLKNLTCLGRHGYPIVVGTTADVDFHEKHIAFAPEQGRRFDLSYAEVSDLVIGGAGATKPGGGFVGGGFGVEGALEGIAIAAVLNALTTKSKINTYLSILTNVGEVHFHYSGMEPGALRIALSQSFTTLRRLDPQWYRSRNEALGLASHLGLCSTEQVEEIRGRLTSPAAVTDPADSWGICPNCKSTIPLLALACPKCKAQFGADSAWKVQPI